MPKKNINDVYDLLDSMLETSQKLIDQANDLVQTTSLFGGELSRIIKQQMSEFFIPTITKLRDDENTPGSIKGNYDYINSIPLWQTRIDPTANDFAEDITNLPEVDPSSLPASASVDQTADIPMNASYNNPQGIQAAETQQTPNNPVQESVLKEKHTKYCIKRRGIENSALGDDVGNIEPHIVNEYNTKAEAEIACDRLNKGVLPSEKEILGTEYFVDTLEFGDDNLLKN